VIGVASAIPVLDIFYRMTCQGACNKQGNRPNDAGWTNSRTAEGYVAQILRGRHQRGLALDGCLSRVGRYILFDLGPSL
jgi:hypothetical protein